MTQEQQNEQARWNIAASERRLHRAALEKCVKLLAAMRDRDRITHPRHELWSPGGQGAEALYEAEKCLKPQYEMGGLNGVRNENRMGR